MSNVIDIFPANDFKVVAESAAKELQSGIIIGYDKEGRLSVFGGGLIDGKHPVCKDWLWMIESFKTKLLNGDYSD